MNESQQQPNKKLHSLDSAAERLDISVHTLRKHQYRGSLHTVKVGRRIMVPDVELQRISERGLPSLAAKK
jgi:predicted site-specific integrase-resolvase